MIINSFRKQGQTDNATYKIDGKKKKNRRYSKRKNGKKQTKVEEQTNKGYSNKRRRERSRTRAKDSQIDVIQITQIKPKSDESQDSQHVL